MGVFTVRALSCQPDGNRNQLPLLRSKRRVGESSLIKSPNHFHGVRCALSQFPEAAEILHDGHRIVFSWWWGHATLLMNSDALAVRLQAHGFVRSATASRKNFDFTVRLHLRMIAPHE
jgi:hypothetical protein